MRYAQLSWLAEFIFPTFCCGCNRRPGVAICDSCSRRLAQYKKQTCFWCKEETPLGITHQQCRCDNEPTLQGIFSVFWYAGMAGRLLRSAKYRFHTPGAIDELCQHIPCSYRFDLLTLQRHVKAQVITYIPLSKDVIQKRGFNQSEYIARQIGSIMQLPVRALVSKKTKTPHQASRGRNERQLNSGMFHASPQGFTSVYLVDDVVTTGNTLCTVTQTLRNGGVRSVYGITLCRS